MDVKPLEAIIAEIGKVFRLCRMYPPTHPSVKQAQAELSAALPDLAKTGPVELRITSAGLQLGSVPLAPRNPPIQEFAALLYAQGFRGLAMEPGLTATEVSALIQAAAGAAAKAAQASGVRTAPPLLPHVHLEHTIRKSAATPRPPAAAVTVGEGQAMGRRSTGVFRPDALPPEIEAARLTAALEHATPAEAPRMLGRLAEVALDLAGRQDMGGFARAVLALAGTVNRAEEGLAAAARAALDMCATPPSVGGMVSRLGDVRAPAEERDTIVQALGVVGARAVPLVVDAYLASGHQDERDILLAVVRRVGEAAAAALGARCDPQARPEEARAYAALLGATRSPAAAHPLADLSRHADAPARALAVAGLGRIGGPEAGRAVVHALRDGDPQVRAAAARALAWIGDASSMPIAVARVGEEHDAEALVPLIVTLGEMRETRAVAALTALARGVISAFQRHPVEVRTAAVRALGAIGTPEALAALEAHRHDRQPELRAAALEFLR